MAKKREVQEQPQIPGMQDVRNERVHKAGLRYVADRDHRMAASKEEKEAHDNLIRIMLEEGVETYHYGDLTIHIDLTRKAKVKKESQTPKEE